MNEQHSYKIINDPIYGFIPITDALVFDLIQNPYFQRLRRISQMGLSYLVYPGAHHTRFHHAIGAMHLMQQAINTLRRKDVVIDEKEERALLVAILLHDMGHGPFSHALERKLVDHSHEDISIFYMEKLNGELEGQLDLAIQIFKGKYHRKFMYELISSQLDMDRLDYLKRDSFYTGVAEGKINAERLITMINVKDDRLVLEEKAVYSAEHFVVGRRLMYWQVYFHKTAIVAESILQKTLLRAKHLLKNGHQLFASPALSFFLTEKPFENTDELLDQFSLLDDYDVLGAIKQWCFHKDALLAYYANAIINRSLLKIKMSNTPIVASDYHNHIARLKKRPDLPSALMADLIFQGKVENRAYHCQKNPLFIQTKDGALKELSEFSDQANLQALSQEVVKYYYCYPK